MNKQVIIAIVAGLVIGVAGTLSVATLANSDDVSSTTSQRTANNHSTMSMADMNKELDGLSGDAYDKAFIEMMIAHHQGAIDMARLSPSRANHAEVKDLSKAIIIAQEKEISDMTQWQVNWGFQPNESEQMMHSGH
jgi:uncharacterized protein (DUF305 family)